MPTISMFFGIIISMRFQEHNPPHFHALYQGKEALFDILSCELSEGNFPPRQRKMVEAWCTIHQEELLADWALAQDHQELFRIDPLK